MTASRAPQRPVRVDGRILGNQLQLRVIDHGPGLPHTQRDRLFAPFQRLTDTTGTGLGLGLAIARGFTEAMGGTLSRPTPPAAGSP